MKNFNINFRLNEKLYKYVKFAASRSGVSISQWLNMVLANIMIRDGEFFDHENKQTD